MQGKDVWRVCYGPNGRGNQPAVMTGQHSRRYGPDETVTPENGRERPTISKGYA
jgi:hypothetical protein